MTDFSGLREAVVSGDAVAAASETHRLLEQGAKPVDLMTDGVSPSMAIVGRLFENGECFVPELLMAARATKEVFKILRPLLSQSEANPRTRIVLGTVRGDQHDIGKNLVAAMLEGGGFEIVDLGVDVPAEKFIAAVRDTQSQILGLSALLTSTLPAMKAVIEAFQAAGLRDQVKIIVGGAPVTQKYADAIGADGYAENAIGAVDVARRLSGDQEEQEIS